MSKRYKGLKAKQNGDFRVAQWRLTNQRLTRGTAVAAYEVPEAVSTRRIKQSAKGISVNPEKYVRDLLKKYDINGSSVKTLMQANLTFNSQLASVQDIKQNPKESHLIDVKRIFRCNMDKKSTLAEYEYVTAARCCENILWMKSQLSDYDIVLEKVPIFYDNTSAIAILNNPVLHSRTKHIDIRYHFIRDHIIKWDIEFHFIPTQYQLTHIFTKPLDEPTFKRLIVELADKIVGYKAPKTTPQTKELGREDKKPRAKIGHMKTIPMMMNNPLSKLEATKGVTGEVRADPQLSSVVSASSTEPLYSASTHMHSESASGHDALADLTAKADVEKSNPKDSLLPRQGTVQTKLEIENELTAENLFVTDTKEVGESSDDDEIKWD
ncbi:hypothetical protein Tco_0782102, partial [Tanacetum coccineum]